MNHESKHDQGWKTFHQIEEPFQDGDGEAKLHELVARIEAWGEPEELILLAADHLKQFAAQHVQDLDALLTEVAEIWSTVECAHHRARLKVVYAESESRPETVPR